MDVDAVVFDVDQTPFDHESSARAGLSSWFQAQRVEPSEPVFRAWFGAEERHTTAWRNGDCSWAEHRRRRLRDIRPLIGRTWGDDGRLDALFEGYLHAYEAAWQPFADAPRCLAALQSTGDRLATLTNGAEEQQRAKVAAIGLTGVFERLLTTEALGVGGPDPRACHAVCDALALPPGRCVYVGDDDELDVAGPRTIGMHAVHLDRAGGAQSDAECSTSLGELLALPRPAEATS